MNTLTNLAPDLYTAADVVSRELVGFIPSITINAGIERAAVNQTIRSHVAPAVSVGNRSAAMTIPEGTAQTVGNQNLTMSNDKSVEIPWTGEEIKFVSSGGIYQTLLGQQFEQAIRAHVNAIEQAIASAAYLGASRAYGTAGTTPFATAGDFTDATNVAKILKDNGAPQSDLSLVIDTTAGAKLLGLQSRYDIAGDTTMQNQGIIIQKGGMSIRESAQIYTPTVGTGASYTTDTAGYAVGDTAITLITGSGTILAGDIVTFAGDSEKYVVASALSGGVITLAEPGLRTAIAASATNVTVVAAAARNIALARSAVELGIRPPAMPEGGDAAVDSMIIQDPRSGLAFEIRHYMGYGKQMFSIACVYGIKVWKTEHVATLLG